MATYADDRQFLQRHTELVELADGSQRVLVCPQYQGRVMTATPSGADGPSCGWINYRFIEAGKSDRQFNNFGGEDRFWLSPEGGQFALFFAPGAEPTFANWITPPGLNEGPFEVVSQSAIQCRMTRRMQLINASRTAFDIQVNRTARILPARRLSELFGAEVAAALDAQAADVVGFETENSIVNLGEAWSRRQGLLSIWILGMFPPGSRTTIIVPYRPGTEAQRGPVVKDDYFGRVPGERLKILPQAILFRGDGRHRSKIGTSQQRAVPVAGSIDLDGQLLTLVHFTQPDDPQQAIYLNNSWDLPQAEPYRGDVFNSYNDGPTQPGAESLGGFYELETLSPSRELATGQSLTHVHRTYHIRGPVEVLSTVCQRVLGVTLEEVRRAMGDA
jgi:hypothetical protein